MMNKTYAHPDSVNGLSTDAVHRILIQIPEGERGHGVVMAWVFFVPAERVLGSFPQCLDV